MRSSTGRLPHLWSLTTRCLLPWRGWRSGMAGWWGWSLAPLGSALVLWSRTATARSSLGMLRWRRTQCRVPHHAVQPGVWWGARRRLQSSSTQWRRSHTSSHTSSHTTSHHVRRWPLTAPPVAGDGSAPLPGPDHPSMAQPRVGAPQGAAGLAAAGTLARGPSGTLSRGRAASCSELGPRHIAGGPNIYPDFPVGLTHSGRWGCSRYICSGVPLPTLCGIECLWWGECTRGSGTQVTHPNISYLPEEGLPLGFPHSGRAGLYAGTREAASLCGVVVQCAQCGTSCAPCSHSQGCRAGTQRCSFSSLPLLNCNSNPNPNWRWM